MATIIVIEDAPAWIAFFEDAPHKKSSRQVCRHRAIGELIEAHSDHIGLTIRVGTNAEFAIVNGAKSELEKAQGEVKRLCAVVGDLQAQVDELENPSCQFCGEQDCDEACQREPAAVSSEEPTP